MNISEKRYPYPVLTPEGDDYDKSAFDVALEVLKSPEEVTLTFTATLSDDGLRRLIGVDKAAKIICHVESPKTVYRRTFDIPLPVCREASEAERLTVRIPAAELSGTVSVCPFIVSTRDIPDYSNEAFNPDYEGEAFAIDNGAVLAEGRQKTFVADTAKEALSLAPSIFVVVPDASPDCKTLRNDFDGEKIKVSMPQKMFEQYGTLRDSPEDRETIWAMVFVPALVEVLTTLAVTRRHDSAGLSEYAERRWYRTIDKALREVFGFGVDSDPFQGGDCVEMASIIVKNSVKESFRTMINGYNNED